jgi:hypothetical protein
MMVTKLVDIRQRVSAAFSTEELTERDLLEL